MAKKTATITVGVPGSGKSTWARNHAVQTGAYVVELDDARFQINGDSADQGNILQVVALRDSWIQEHSENGNSIIVSDTNLNEEFRDKLHLDLINKGYQVRVLVMDTPHEVSRARNKARTTPVPDDVMDRMIAEFDRQFNSKVPQGWDYVQG